MRKRKRKIKYATGSVEEQRMDTTIMKRSRVDSKEKVQRPWLKHVGKLKHLRREAKRIEYLTHQQTEKIDLEMWR